MANEICIDSKLFFMVIVPCITFTTLSLIFGLYDVYRYTHDMIHSYDNIKDD